MGRGSLRKRQKKKKRTDSLLMSSKEYFNSESHKGEREGRGLFCQERRHTYIIQIIGKEIRKKLARRMLREFVGKKEEKREISSRGHLLRGNHRLGGKGSRYKGSSFLSWGGEFGLVLAVASAGRKVVQPWGGGGGFSIRDG